MKEPMIFYFNKWMIKRCLLFAAAALIIMICLKLRFTPSNSLHPEKTSTYCLNFEKFHYLIRNEICLGDIFLLILIHSAPNHFHHRNLIRNTWGNPDVKSFSVKVVFLLAAAPEFQTDIEKENNLHRDIIQGNFVDSYRNLTCKHVMGLKWAYENCFQAKYLMKMDDDIFMDIYQFMDYIKTHFTPQRLRSSIACFVQSGMPVVRDPVSKWYVSKAEYSPDVFENYCSGWAYLTTSNVAYYLVQAVQELNYFWVDDFHITGSAAKIANVSHVKLNQLFDLESDGLVEWSQNSVNLNWKKMFAPTWGDLVLSRKAYIKSLKCYVMGCKCCYVRTTMKQPTKPSTTRRGVAKAVEIYK